jgi:hypothetical protein
VGVVAIALVACAVLLLAGAEWPRLSARFGSDARAGRKRARRKEALTVIEGQAAEDDFARSVERDLDKLPVLGEHDDRSRR